MARGTYTTQEAAEIIGCHPSSVLRLVKRGLIPNDRIMRPEGGRTPLVFKMTKVELAELRQHFTRSTGYHRKVTASLIAPEEEAAEVQQGDVDAVLPVRTDHVELPEPVRAEHVPDSRLADALAFASMPEELRRVLLALANRHPLADLALLLEL